MLYSRIVETYAKIEATAKRLEITSFLVELIQDTPRSILDKVVYLTQGKLYPDFLGIELGVAEKLLFRVLAKTTGQTEAKATAIYKKLGDLGTVAEELLKDKTQSSFQIATLTVEEVYRTFDLLAHEADQVSVNSTIRQINSLFGKASP